MSSKESRGAYNVLKFHEMLKARDAGSLECTSFSSFSSESLPDVGLGLQQGKMAAHQWGRALRTGHPVTLGNFSARAQGRPRFFPDMGFI